MVIGRTSARAKPTEIEDCILPNPPAAKMAAKEAGCAAHGNGYVDAGRKPVGEWTRTLKRQENPNLSDWPIILAVRGDPPARHK